MKRENKNKKRQKHKSHDHSIIFQGKKIDRRLGALFIDDGDKKRV